MAMAGQAEAKGCIKGALVDGIAVHFAGRGVVGAVGGCVAGRALAKRNTEQAQQPVPGRGTKFGMRAAAYVLPPLSVIQRRPPCGDVLHASALRRLAPRQLSS